MFIEKDNVRLAFALNIAAGLSTCLGGIVIFMKKFVHLANRTSLSVALGMSAGVMIFISLVEIFHESMKNFRQGLAKSSKDEDCDDRCQGHSLLFSSLCFLLGVVIVYLVDKFIHWISPDVEQEPEMILEELEALRDATTNLNLNFNGENRSTSANEIPIENSSKRKQSNQLDDRTKEKLKRTGILTAVAIAIHNFPEGIATYLGTLKNPRLGFALAIGIALHNIPEGVAVATPVYYATESRMKAFLWTFVSSLFEPLGGFICWILIPNGVGHFLEGTIFGLITGVMVTISFKELIPTAHRYSSNSERVTLAIFAGITIMNLSLILFAYAGV